MLAPRGCAGFIVPGGIVTDDTTKEYFQALLDGSVACQCASLRKRESCFQGTPPCVSVRAVDDQGVLMQADLCVLCSRRAVDLGDHHRHFELTPADFAALNPNTRTCPTFRSASRRQHQLDDIPPCGSAVERERPGRKSVGLEVPEHVSIWPMTPASFGRGPSWRRLGGDLTKIKFERDGEVDVASIRGKDDSSLRSPIRHV